MISSTEPKVIRANRALCSLNELPTPTRSRTAARKTVVRTQLSLTSPALLLALNCGVAALVSVVSWRAAR